MRHGGDLGEAQTLYGVRDDWLDLSTGINPQPWPVPSEQEHDLQLSRLPTSKALAELLAVARTAYGVGSNIAICALPGTELAIRTLPALCSDLTLISPTTYASYDRAFSDSGSPLSALRRDLSVNVDPSASIVVVNPNNPDGRRYDPSLLLAIARSRRNEAILVIDEAFADAEEQVTISPLLQKDDRALVLKSFGKFFGLPGLRLGFAVGHADSIERLTRKVGDWPVSGPALSIGTRALRDLTWQKENRLWLNEMGSMMDKILALSELKIAGRARLFRLIETDKAARIHDGLARAGIWTRRFDSHPTFLRFGMPPNEAALERLNQSLSQILSDIKHGSLANRLSQKAD